MRSQARRASACQCLGRLVLSWFGWMLASSIGAAGIA